MTEAEKAACHERVLKLTSLATGLGQHRNALAAMIRGAALMPFAPNGWDFRAIYLRADLASILGQERTTLKKA